MSSPREKLEKLLALANDKCNSFESAIAYKMYLRLKATLPEEEAVKKANEEAEKECHDVVDNLNKRLSTLVYNKNNIVTIKGCGNVIIKFPSGKTAIIEIDSIRETAFIVENGWRY